MSKLVLYIPDKTFVENRAGSIDERRNAIGYIPTAEGEAFCNELVRRFAEQGIPAEFFVKRYVGNDSLRVVLNDCTLVEELKDLSKKKDLEVGFFLENPIIRSGSEKGLYKQERDNDHLMIWIYLTVHKKALTRFRNFLLSEIFDIQAEPARTEA